MLWFDLVAVNLAVVPECGCVSAPCRAVQSAVLQPMAQSAPGRMDPEDCKR